MNIPTYAMYKYSGWEWLGNIPEHWDLNRLRYCALPVNEKLDGEKCQLPYTGLEHIESWTGKRFYDSEETISESQVNHYLAGDVLFGKLRPYLAKVFKTEEEGICTGELLVLRPKLVTQSYLFYFMLNRSFIRIVDSSAYGVKMPRANWDIIGNLNASVPPMEEQHAISAFLDRETARIDGLIEKKLRQIELLKEKRAVIISHAVTKGLDPNVKMKDSGIEWLGEVPEHWKVERLKCSINRLINGVWGDDTEGTENDLPCIRVADFNRISFRVRLDEPTLRCINLKERQGRSLERNDLLLEKSGGGELQPVGVVVMYDHDETAVCSNFIARMTVAHGCDPAFLTYLHASFYFNRVNTRSIKQTTGIQNLDSAAYLNETACFPPLHEQQEIAILLVRETGRIDVLIEKVNQSIELLHEYRTALISETVTGKIDVREEIN